jgi:negative regulator of sigma-B (phosphoserine phosphatase)
MVGLTCERGVIRVPAGGGALTWAMAARPFPGEATSGDRHLALPPPAGPLLAVIDGLGHGPEAAEVAELAVVAFCSVPASASVEDRIDAGDRGLSGTRGAVAALAGIDSPGELVWAGVGNVEVVLLRPGADGRLTPACALVSSPGILGMRPWVRRVTRCQLRGGDLLLMATDGIAPAHVGDVSFGDDLEAVVERVVRTCARDSDDALMLAARYTEMPS